MLIFFLKGAILGFAIAAPVGPIGLLCIRRSISFGAKYGFLAGLGAATADTFFGAVVAFSLTWISDRLLAWQGYLQFFGGILLVLIGIKLLRDKNKVEELPLGPISFLKSFFSTMLLTFSNPATVISFTVLIAAFDFGLAAKSYIDASALTVGVFCGSTLWWWILSQTSVKLKSVLKVDIVQKVNFGAGLVLLLFGVFALINGLRLLA